MTGARATHNTIALNVALALRESLRAPCRVFIADMKLYVALADASFYADMFISCDPRSLRCLLLAANAARKAG